MKVPLLNKLLIALIISIRPLFGYAQCRFTISCTKYAKIQLNEKNFFPAVIAIIKRVLSCNPFL